MPAVYDPFYIPNAPGGIWRRKNGEVLYLRYVSLHPRRLREVTMSFPGEPGFKPINGETCGGTTLEVAEELGLNEHYVNTNLDRICVFDCVLMGIPYEEYKRRRAEKEKAHRETVSSLDDAFMAAAEQRGVKPRVLDPEEYEDRKSYATKPRSRVYLNRGQAAQ